MQFVDLAPLADPALVPSAVARVLGVPEAKNRSAFEALREHMGTRRVLLVLDNFEHLLGAARDIGGLLAACSGLETRPVAMRRGSKVSK